MSPTLLATVVLAACALPPHPLNRIIGGPTGNEKPARAEEVARNILNSDTFEAMVRSCVKAVENEEQIFKDEDLRQMSFPQRVQYFLANSLENRTFVEDWEPSAVSRFQRPKEWEQISEMDYVVGYMPHTADEVLQSFRESPIFFELLLQALQSAEPLANGTAGANYAEQVRLEIGRLIMHSPPSIDENADDVEMAPPVTVVNIRAHHPLDRAIGGYTGNQKRQPEQVAREILRSRAFESMVRAAVAMNESKLLRGDLNTVDMNFGQRVRMFLAGSIEDVSFTKEYQPSPFVSDGKGVQPMSVVEKTIGPEAGRVDVVLKRLRASREFFEVLRRAAELAQPAAGSSDDLTYAQAVRQEIARLLNEMPKIEEADAGSEAP